MVDETYTNKHQELSDSEKQKLLEIARKTIECVANGKRPPEFKIDFPVLYEKRGAFVTLHRKGTLRGCIGYVYAYKPLYLSVIEMAEAAAMRDPRFTPIAPKEVQDLDIEISVLSPLTEIDNIEEITIGVHGILIERGHASGLLLPQVATEHGWDRETFLNHTCVKAGLHPGSWKEHDAMIKIFSAEIFGTK